MTFDKAFQSLMQGKIIFREYNPADVYFYSPNTKQILNRYGIYIYEADFNSTDILADDWQTLSTTTPYQQ